MDYWDWINARRVEFEAMAVPVEGTPRIKASYERDSGQTVSFTRHARPPQVVSINGVPVEPTAFVPDTGGLYLPGTPLAYDILVSAQCGQGAPTLRNVRVAPGDRIVDHYRSKIQAWDAASTAGAASLPA